MVMLSRTRCEVSPSYPLYKKARTVILNNKKSNWNSYRKRPAKSPIDIVESHLVFGFYNSISLLLFCFVFSSYFSHKNGDYVFEMQSVSAACVVLPEFTFIYLELPFLLFL